MDQLAAIAVQIQNDHSEFAAHLGPYVHEVFGHRNFDRPLVTNNDGWASSVTKRRAFPTAGAARLSLRPRRFHRGLSAQCGVRFGPRSDRRPQTAATHWRNRPTFGRNLIR